ncbi:MAG: hypothetical protein KAV83_08610 [Desulfobacterales bacterium]|nr:hypothetical protein [Desulfobacterales bacterium]
MDKASRPGTVWAVVQAFGGPKHEPAGWPRIPTTGFKTMDNKCLLLVVNVIDRPVKGLIQGIPTSFSYLDDPFVRQRYVVKQGTVLGEFEPYEVKVLVGVSA